MVGDEIDEGFWPPEWDIHAHFVSVHEFSRDRFVVGTDGNTLYHPGFGGCQQNCNSSPISLCRQVDADELHSGIPVSPALLTCWHVIIPP